MSKGAGIIALLGLAGAGAYYVTRQRSGTSAEAQPVAYIQTTTTTPGRSSSAGIVDAALGLVRDWASTREKPSGQTVRDTFGSAFEDMFKIDTTPAARSQPARETIMPRRSTTTGGNLRPLLDLIGRYESGNDYNKIWGGIGRSDYPSRPLTQMTVQQVLDWQDSIDRKYNSEASGKYQFMEDTLRGLVREGHARPNEMFNAATQDRLAIALLKRRGLDRYRAGTMSATQFAQNLSMEWASFPAQTRDARGRAATGQSYYAGDGLNRSHTSKESVLQAVRVI